MSKYVKPRHLLLSFLGWSAFFALLYHPASKIYMSLVMDFTEVITGAITPLTFRAHPLGYLILSHDASQPMGFPFQLLYTIGSNIIFAPALVLATVGTNLSGIKRAIVAIVIMVLLHTVQAVVIVLSSLVDPGLMTTPLTSAPEVTVTINWISHFIDKMSFAFFPFLAWVLVCSDIIFDLFNAKADSEYR